MPTQSGGAARPWGYPRYEWAPLIVAVAFLTYAGGYLMPRERARIIDEWRWHLEGRVGEIAFDVDLMIRQQVDQAGLVVVLADADRDAAAVARPASGSDPSSRLTRGAAMHGWTSAFLFGTAGDLRAAGGPESGESGTCREIGRRALLAGTPAIDVIAGAAQGSRAVVAVPVEDRRAEAAGSTAVAVVAMPAERELFPRLLPRTERHDEIQAYLLHREEGRWVRLSPIGERGETPAAFRACPWPGDSRVGPSEFVALTDDRGVPVFASVHSIPGTPWLAVAQIPEDTVSAEIGGRHRTITLECLLLGLALGVGSYGLWHRRRGQMEASLRGLRLRYEDLFEQANDAILVLSPDGRILEANHRAEELHERSREELLRLSLADLAGPAGGPGNPLPGTVGLECGCAVTESGLRQECIQYRKDGTALPVEFSSRRLRIEGEEVTIAIFRDLRLQKQQQAELLASERHYRLLFENNPSPMWVYDSDSLRFLEVNEAAIRHYGYAREQWPAMTIRDIRPSDEVPRLLQALAGPRERPHRAGVWRHRTRDGRVIHVDIVAHAIRFGDRDAQLVIASDVTERVVAEARLHLLERAVEQSPVSLMITGPEGRIEYVNPMFTQVTGYSAEECRGRTPAILKSGRHEPSFYAELWATIRAGREWRGQFHNRRKNGELYWASAVIAPVTNGADRILHFVAVEEDVTDRRRLEEQFRQAQKMEAVGRLAGGVAHDFNNLLTVISGFTELSLVGLAEGDKRVGHLREVARAAERAASLTRQLLAFSRKQILQPRVMNLNDAVTGTERMLKRLLGEDIEVRAHCAPDLDLVLADPGQIEQVLLNLAVNARDAMPNGGRLTIETANIELDESYAAMHPGSRPGPQVMLAVSDTGTGMTEEVKAHLFEPFFTTKGLGKGTGLGLATIYGIVKQSGGTIRVYSELGKGTSFKVYLPRVDSSAGAQARPVAEAAPRGGHETILVAEDEDGVSRIALSILAEAGYTVLVAADGEAALAVAAKTNGLHLLLTDLVMPKLNGLELAERLIARQPSLRVLYMSGYASRAPGESGVLPPGADFLQKPFTPRTLLAKVRAVLDGVRAEPA